MLNRVLPNGTVVPRDNQFTKNIAANGTQNHFFCAMLNEDWFTDERFNIECAKIDMVIMDQSDQFVTKPKPFGTRYIFKFINKGWIIISDVATIQSKSAFLPL